MKAFGGDSESDDILGDAEVSKEMSKNWEALMSTFFEGISLHTLMVNIQDARHPNQKSDQEFHQFLKAFNFETFLLFNKIDKLKKQKENLSIQMEKLTGDPIETQDTLTELQIEINNLQKEYDKRLGVYTIDGERLSRADLKSLIEQKQNRFNILNEQEVDTSFAQ